MVCVHRGVNRGMDGGVNRGVNRDVNMGSDGFGWEVEGLGVRMGWEEW